MADLTTLDALAAKLSLAMANASLRPQDHSVGSVLLEGLREAYELGKASTNAKPKK